MAQKKDSVNLGDMLLNEGLINYAQIEEARKRRNKSPEKSIGQILVEMGVITESVKMSFLKKKFGYDYFSLEKSKIDPHILTFIPRAYAFKYHLIPIKIAMEALIVAMDDPSDLELLENLKATVNMPIRPVIASTADIDEALKMYPEISEEIIIIERPPSILYRAIKYAAFPILGFLPLLIVIALIKFNPAFSNMMSEKLGAGSDFDFDVFLYTLLGWGLWVIIVWEINGLIFHEKETGEENDEFEE
jgi:type II secretion system (T2SS) protein E